MGRRKHCLFCNEKIREDAIKCKYCGSDLVQIDPSLAKTYLNGGSERYSKGDYKGAIADYEKALQIDKNCAEACCKLIELHHFLSIPGVSFDSSHHEFLAKDYWEKARNIYTEAIEANPNNAEAYINRGRFRRAGFWEGYYDRDGAIADFTKAIEIAPNCAEAYFELGDYTKAIEINPRFARAYYYRGLFSPFNRAIADFTKALEIDSSYHEALNGRGLAYLNNDDFDAAVADFTRAIEISTKTSEGSLSWLGPTDYYLNRGYAYLLRSTGRSIRFKKEVNLIDEWVWRLRILQWVTPEERSWLLKERDKGASEDELKSLEEGFVKVCHEHREMIRKGKDDLYAAITDFTRAMEICPKYAQPNARILVKNCLSLGAKEVMVRWGVTAEELDIYLDVQIAVKTLRRLLKEVAFAPSEREIAVCLTGFLERLRE